LITEFFFLSVNEQKKLPVREWLEYFDVAMRKHKQKLEWMSLNHQ
jgi:hypothetical protein